MDSKVLYKSNLCILWEWRSAGRHVHMDIYSGCIHTRVRAILAILACIFCCLEWNFAFHSYFNFDRRWRAEAVTTPKEKTLHSLIEFLFEDLAKEVLASKVLFCQGKLYLYWKSLVELNNKPYMIWKPHQGSHHFFWCSSSGQRKLQCGILSCLWTGRFNEKEACMGLLVWCWINTCLIILNIFSPHTFNHFCVKLCGLFHGHSSWFLKPCLQTPLLFFWEMKYEKKKIEFQFSSCNVTLTQCSLIQSVVVW